jgi:hypothetical protein
MISLLVAFLANPISPCTAALTPASHANNQVTVLADLVLTYHGAYLTEPGQLPTRCGLFPIFPGTPSFLTPGVKDQERRRDRKIEEFMARHKRAGDNSDKRIRVLISGFLKVVDNFKYDSAVGRGNGFGYRGPFRVAVVVSHISEVPAVVVE